MHEPNVHIESEIHVLRAKAMLSSADEGARREEQQKMLMKTQVTKKEAPLFTKSLQDVTAKEGQQVR